MAHATNTRAELEREIGPYVDIAYTLLSNTRLGAYNEPRSLAFYLNKVGGEVLAVRMRFQHDYTVLMFPGDAAAARIEAHGQARAAGDATLTRLKARRAEVWKLNWPTDGDITYSHSSAI